MPATINVRHLTIGACHKMSATVQNKFLLSYLPQNVSYYQECQVIMLDTYIPYPGTWNCQVLKCHDAWSVAGIAFLWWDNYSPLWFWALNYKINETRMNTPTIWPLTLENQAAAEGNDQEINKGVGKGGLGGWSQIHVLCVQAVIAKGRPKFSIIDWNEKGKIAFRFTVSSVQIKD